MEFPAPAYIFPPQEEPVDLTIKKKLKKESNVNSSQQNECDQSDTKISSINRESNASNLHVDYHFNQFDHKKESRVSDAIIQEDLNTIRTDFQVRKRKCFDEYPESAKRTKLQNDTKNDYSQEKTLRNLTDICNINQLMAINMYNYYMNLVNVRKNEKSQSNSITNSRNFPFFPEVQPILPLYRILTHAINTDGCSWDHYLPSQTLQNPGSISPGSHSMNNVKRDLLKDCPTGEKTLDSFNNPVTFPKTSGRHEALANSQSSQENLRTNSLTTKDAKESFTKEPLIPFSEPLFSSNVNPHYNVLLQPLQNGDKNITQNDHKLPTFERSFIKSRKHLILTVTNEKDRRKRNSRVLTGKYVQSGTGASVTTLNSLKRTIEERMKNRGK